MAAVISLLGLILIVAGTLVMNQLTYKTVWATNPVEAIRVQLKVDLKKRQSIILQEPQSLSRSHSQVPNWV